MERISTNTSAVVGPWAKEKLSVLESYLDYYTLRLKNQAQWKTIYLDAFAGGGTARVRRSDQSQNASLWEDASPEQIEFIAGSPRRALQLRNPFDNYIFIDSNQSRIASLFELKKEFDRPGIRISVRAGTADEQIAWLLSHKPNPKNHRGIAFLDPYGAHIGWASIEGLAKTRLFEVIINFPLHMCLNRLMTKNPDEMRETWRTQLDTFFPDGWYDEIYVKARTLLGENLQKHPDALERILDWYVERLKGQFGFVAKPRLITNTNGGPLYYLIWAGPNAAGLTGANHIMKMADTNFQN